MCQGTLAGSTMRESAPELLSMTAQHSERWQSSRRHHRALPHGLLYNNDMSSLKKQRNLTGLPLRRTLRIASTALGSALDNTF